MTTTQAATLFCAVLGVQMAAAEQPQSEAQMQNYRDDAVAKIQSENREALHRSLQQSFNALQQQTRDRYLAQKSGASPGNSTQAAP